MSHGWQATEALAVKLFLQVKTGKDTFRVNVLLLEQCSPDNTPSLPPAAGNSCSQGINGTYITGTILMVQNSQ